MRTRGLWLLACLLLAVTGLARAQANPADDEAIRRLTDNFFDAFRQGGGQGVAAYLRQSGSIEEDVLRPLGRRRRGGGGGGGGPSFGGRAARAKKTPSAGWSGARRRWSGTR